MKIEKHLALAPSHITIRTREWLDRIDWTREGPSGGAVTYGWFMHAPDENTCFPSAPHAPVGEYPADLWACFEAARALGCSHVRFDEDEAESKDLPVHEDVAARNQGRHRRCPRNGGVDALHVDRCLDIYNSHPDNAWMGMLKVIEETLRAFGRDLAKRETP